LAEEIIHAHSTFGCYLPAKRRRLLRALGAIGAILEDPPLATLAVADDLTLVDAGSVALGASRTRLRLRRWCWCWWWGRLLAVFGESWRGVDGQDEDGDDEEKIHIDDIDAESESSVST
jgi:hypothetical protein